MSAETPSRLSEWGISVRMRLCRGPALIQLVGLARTLFRVAVFLSMRLGSVMPYRYPRIDIGDFNWQPSCKPLDGRLSRNAILESEYGRDADLIIHAAAIIPDLSQRQSTWQPCSI